MFNAQAFLRGRGFSSASPRRACRAPTRSPARKPFSSSFPFEELFLALEAPTVAASLSVGADDSVARDADGDRIRGAGLSHRPGGPGAADAGRDLRVGGGGAGRDPRARLPGPAR